MGLCRFFLLFLFVSCTRASSAQGAAGLDSLALKLKAARSDMAKAEVLFGYGDEISTHDTINAVAYIKKGLALVKGNQFYEGKGYFYLGRVYMEFSGPKAEAAFGTAIHCLEQVDSPEAFILLSRTWANKAILAQRNGDNRKYIDIFLHHAIPLAARGGDSLRMAEGYVNIALPFMDYEQYDKAIGYLIRAISTFKRLAPEDLRQVDYHTHLAKIYLAQDNVNDARQHLDQASSILSRAPESLYAPYFHTVEAMYFIKQELWKKAESTLDEGLVVAKNINSRYDMRQLLYQKARLFDFMDDWDASKKILLKLYNEGYMELQTDQKQLFADLARLESHLGNYRSAYNWMVKHEQVSEDLYTMQTKTQIAALEARYNYAQKEKELLVSKGKANRKQAILWTFVLGLSFLLLLGMLWYRNRKLKTAQQFRTLKQQQQIELGHALLEGEERERSRVARDLHDGLGGMLAGIKLNLSQLIDKKDIVAKEELVQTVARLGHSVDELRRIARNMMPESLIRSGLQEALKDLCEEAAMPSLKIIFNAFEIREDFSPQVQLVIYRIVQELVHNAVKHAGASRIMVQCSQAEDTFYITVEDDGKGFPTDNPSGKGRGLKNINDRVNFLNGIMNIEFTSEGTVINIELHVKG